MLDLPLDLYIRIMQTYFTHHVIEELHKVEHKPRVTNEIANNFVCILNIRINNANKNDKACPKDIKRLLYARDRWSNHIFCPEEVGKKCTKIQ